MSLPTRFGVSLLAIGNFMNNTANNRDLDDDMRHIAQQRADDDLRRLEAPRAAHRFTPRRVDTPSSFARDFARGFVSGIKRGYRKFGG